ncbi:MAG TPA: PAS domain S-box protein [Burkholderiales bacterium]|nr:PAS domain S-box protein [Burkholderiales bacterium]
MKLRAPSRTEDVLRSAALAVSTAAGEGVFRELVRALAAILDVEIAFIALSKPPDRCMLGMLAYYADGRMIDDFEYPIAGTPCETVVGRQFRCYPSGLKERFPLDADFIELGVEGYAGYPLNDARGEAVGLMVVAARRPITEPELIESVLKIFAARAMVELERRRAEQGLRASEEQYRAIFNASFDSMIIRTLDGEIVDANPALLSMYGYSREELIGRTFGPIIPEKLAGPYRAYLAEAASGKLVRTETRLPRKDGTHVDIEVLGSLVTYNGRPHVLSVARDITERKRAEAALRSSEEQYRAIFNASEDALVLWDSSMRRVDINPAYERLYGWTREEVVGRGYDALGLPADYAEPRLELVRRTLAGETCRVELESLRKNGERFQADIRTIPVVHRGEPHVLAIVRDITARKAAEGALRASEEQYRAIFNATADALVLRDAQFRIVDVNAAYESMSGRRREKVIGLTDLTLTRNASAVDRRRLHAEALAGKSVDFEADGRRPDGSPFVLEVRGVPMTYRGEPHVLYIGRDATEAKLAEQALRASEEQYRAVFVASLDALVLRDESFRIVDVNPSYEKMSGYARAEVEGADHVVANPPEIDAAVKALHRRALAGEPVRMEAQMIRRDGRPIDIELSGVRTMYQGRPHVLYAGRDITARRQAEARHRELEAQLRQAQKMEAIGHLTGGIAHDFNNILTGIMGYLTLAGEREAASSDAKLARHLQQAQHGATRAKELIQQMLAFSRAQRGKPRAVSLAPLAEEAVKLLGSSLPATVELRTELEQGLPAVMIDPVQVEQILLNLCINARDAMDGAGKITVGVRHAAQGAAPRCASCHKPADGRYVELAVADSGPGIAPAVLERMFEPFFSTKEVGRGSGMGLATVHGIVHEHGGHVVVETAPGRGATFRVLLPALEGEVESDVRRGAEAARAKPLRHALDGRVLLVDDEQMVGEFMAELLGGWGLEVTVLRSPVEAERWLAEDPARVDLVLTDQTMPKMTGLELARRVAALRPGLPVILYSGYAENIGAEQLARSGVRALLAKPVEPEPLFAALVEALRR